MDRYSNDHPMTVGEFNHSINRQISDTLGVLGALYLIVMFIRAPAIVRLWLIQMVVLPFVAIMVMAGNAPVPVFSILVWGLWIYWTVGGARRFSRMDDVQQQQMVAQQQQAEYDAAVQRDVNKVRYDYALAQETGRAVAEALRNQRPPEGPTGAPQRPTAPTPGPTPPMGSSSSPLWMPTYMGPSKPVQRREITMGGNRINDARGVDPDAL